jgi:hypothetical protein
VFQARISHLNLAAGRRSSLDVSEARPSLTPNEAAMMRILLLTLLLLLTLPATAELDHAYTIPGTSLTMRVPFNYTKFVRLPDGYRCTMPKWTIEVRIKEYPPLTDYKKRTSMLVGLRDTLDPAGTRVSGSSCEGWERGRKSYVYYSVPTSPAQTHLRLLRMTPAPPDEYASRIYSAGDYNTKDKTIIKPGKVTGSKYSWPELKSP